MCSTPMGHLAELPQLTAALRFLARDADLGADAASSAELIDLIAATELTLRALGAAQARLTVAFDLAQRAEQRIAGIPSRRIGQGVTEQLALARRVSPTKASHDLTTAKTLCGEMVHSLRSWADGDINDYQAALIVRANRMLEVEDRILADLQLSAPTTTSADGPSGTTADGPSNASGPTFDSPPTDSTPTDSTPTDSTPTDSTQNGIAAGTSATAAPSRLAGWSNRRIDAEARRIAYRLAPQAYVDAMRRAVTERRVTARPAVDGMEYITGLVPMKAGVAIIASLRQHAQSLRAQGDPRSLDQIQADTFVERLTGRATAEIPVNVTLVMADTTLLDGDHEPVEVGDRGPIPARIAREWLREVSPTARVAVRRLITDPVSGRIEHFDSRARTFTGVLRELIETRDRFCSTPFCGAPLRQVDHVTPHAAGGPTSFDNGAGTCERCNYARSLAGWSTEVFIDPDGRRILQVTTPTGHRYQHSPADLPGSACEPTVSLGSLAETATSRRRPPPRP